VIAEGSRGILSDEIGYLRAGSRHSRMTIFQIFQIVTFIQVKYPNSPEDLIYNDNQCNASFRKTEETLETDNGWKELPSRQEHR